MEKKKRALTMKQEMFVQAYCETMNATVSYMKVYGTSEDVAAAASSRLLRNVNLQDRIEEIRKYTTGKFNVSRERIAKEYARIAFGDRTGIFNEEGNLRPFTELSEDLRAIIGEVTLDELYAGETNIGVTKKIKTYDKKGALDSLAKMFGFNEPEKIKGEIENKYPNGILQVQIILPPEGTKDKEL